MSICALATAARRKSGSGRPVGVTQRHRWVSMRFLRSGFALVSRFPVGTTGNDAKRKAWVRTGEVGMQRWQLGGTGRPEWERRT